MNRVLATLHTGQATFRVMKSLPVVGVEAVEVLGVEEEMVMELEGIMV